MRLLKEKKGSILVFAIWMLSLLTIFAVQIGLGIRSRINLLSAIENRSQLRWVGESAINKSIASLRRDIVQFNNTYTPYGKFYRHNNDVLFKDIRIGSGRATVSYLQIDENNPVGELTYGVVDCERKLNINTANIIELKHMFLNVLGFDEETSSPLVEAIIDWREEGRKHITGFYSQDYYAGLPYPYEPKNAFLESMDELLLVQGYTPELINVIKPFVTIYGNGSVNINTAPKAVLLSIGLSENIVDKILLVRRGFDGLDFTIDDYVFQRTYDIAIEMLPFVEVTPTERREIDVVNAAGKIKTNSDYYRIEAVGNLEGRKGKIQVSSVYNAAENRIEFWNEKF